MALAAHGKIRRTITTIAFAQVNEHLDRIRVGEVVGRTVVKF